MEFKKYKKEGQAGMAVGSVISLIIGVGVAVLVIIMVGVLGGKAYNISEPSINNISDATIQTNVKTAVRSGFGALEDTGEFLPLIVLAFIIFIVISLVLGFTAFGGRGGGSAL